MSAYIASIVVTEKDDGVHVGYRGETESDGVYVKYVNGEPGAQGFIGRTRHEAIGEFIMKKCHELGLWMDTDNQRKK